MKTAVVILNWNGRKYLEKFLPLLLNRTENAEIIVADNASTDDSVEFMQHEYPDVRLIKNDKNYGFAGGYNKALSQVESEYYVLLNSDIEVTENWLEPLIKVLDEDKSIAAVQPKILDFYDRNKFEYAGASGGYIDKYGFPFCRGRLFQTLETDNLQYDDIKEIFWATGACLVVRSDVYNSLNGLDEDFFAHMEEIDFCWRIHNAGHTIVVVPQSKVYHIGGGTLPKSSSRKTYLNFRNNYLLLYKNLPSNKLFKILFFRLFFDWFAAIKFLFDGNIGDFKAVFKAQLKSFSSFYKHKHKRKLNINFSEKMIYDGSIVFDYYLFKKKYFSELKINKFSDKTKSIN